MRGSRKGGGRANPVRARRRTRTRFVLAGVVSLLGACELEEITVVDVEDVVVAEVYVNLAEDPALNEVIAFLHRTVGTGDDDLDDLRASTVTLSRADGFTISLAPTGTAVCVRSEPSGEVGACFASSPDDAAQLRPGDVLDLTIDVVGEGFIEGTTRLPGDFALEEPAPTCRLDPDSVVPIAWSESEDAWAYVNETSIAGIRAALEPEGITVDDDPLYLLGLSISDEDTDILFPSEFGVFNRFELDSDLSIRLQRGIPEGTTAEVTITAVERNYVNWARGGSFNPSGQVRVPSLRGAGTGVIGGAVVRRFEIVSSSDTELPYPECEVG